MPRDHPNTWLEQDSAQVDTYLDTADAIIVERECTQKLLVDLFRYHFEDCENLNILDLGCGDGTLTKRLRDRYPHNAFHLMDGSLAMLEKAKVNLPGENVTFLHQTFETYIGGPCEAPKYDFVHSANAIHHLNLDHKAALFAKVYGEMRPGGLFLIIDPVRPTSERSEQWQFKMWIDWMNERLLAIDRRADTGRYDHIPELYKSEAENKPSTLRDQLDRLADAGFRDVDCFYKYGIFSLFGGTKDKDCSHRIADRS